MSVDLRCSHHWSGVCHDSYWDPYLQVPHVNLVNHCHISSLTDQLSSIASSNDFVPVVDASVFSDSFLVFNEVVPVARVQEGVLYETEEVNRGIPEEAFFYMVTLPGASSPVAMTTVSGEAPWQLLLTNSSIKVYRRPFPGASVFQYKGEVGQIKWSCFWYCTFVYNYSHCVAIALYSRKI